MEPVALVLSFGYSKPIEIVTKLINSKASCPTSEPKEIQINENQYETYVYNIKNKYFEIDLKLLPYDKPISDLPKELLRCIEALIVSFDSADKSFLTHLPELCEFAVSNDIELALLMTGQFHDDSSNNGLSYSDVKDICKQRFDVIEVLNQDKVTHQDAAENEPKGSESSEDYSELIEAIENHIWSNVKSSTSKSVNKNLLKENNTVANSDSPDADDDADDHFDEQQLEAYEALLANIVNFKNNTANLDRDQKLDEAEKLAKLLTGLMGDE